jgi:hypothetical protein
MLNFVENLPENERGPMNGQDLTKTDYDPDRSLALSRVSLTLQQTLHKTQHRVKQALVKRGASKQKPPMG